MTKDNTKSKSPKVRTKEKAEGNGAPPPRKKSEKGTKVRVGTMKRSALEKRNVSTMHSSRCNVCKSPNLRDIEEAYLAWESPYNLVLRYPETGSVYSIYRHMEACGLKERRNDDLKGALRTIIDRGMVRGLEIRDNAVLRAIELLAKLDGKLKDSGANVTVGVTVEELAEKRAANQRLGLERFGVKVTTDSEER